MERSMTRACGLLLEGEPLARHTSWRVGGAAWRFYRPASTDALARFLRGLPPQEPLLWLGLGSNLLVRDAGFAGTVIATHGGLDKIARLDGATLRVEAGAPTPKVARLCGDLGLGEAEFLAGIPGTLGGALAMNAGAYGGATWDHVAQVETIDREGVIRLRGPGDYRIGYRQVTGAPGEWFVAAHLRFTPTPRNVVRARIRSLLAARNAAQPLGLPSAGSVFRNPPGDYAARLIERSGLKGLSLGAAVVSARHANFIVNQGGAWAADIEALMAQVAETVLARHGVRLRPEVHVVGEAQPAREVVC
jgi:UDP-N-acetylmuramate dehydrogenase